MNHDGGLLCQALLEYTAARVLFVLLNESLDDIFLQRGEDLDIALGILVGDVQPELIEAVGCSALRVEPDVAALRFAKLLAVALRDEGTSKGESLYFVASGATNQLGASGHVAPLVVTAQL